MLQQRQAGDAAQLGAALAAASPGRAPSLWQELPAVAATGALPPLLLVAGQQDGKFVGIARKLADSLALCDGDTAAGGVSPAHANGDAAAADALPCAPAVRVALVPGCGHAVHLEQPMELLALLRQFSGSTGEANA